MRILCSCLLLSSLLLLGACEDRGDEVVAAPALAAETPNSFLRYLNTQASLAAGSYTVVVATNAVGRSGSYVLQVTYDDGHTGTFSGNWTASGGQDPVAAGNKRHDIVLARAGGLRITMTSAVDGYLYLLRDGRVVAEADAGGSGGAPLINLALSKINSVDYANAYYAAVDPDGDRATIEAFKRKNCFVEAPHCLGNFGVQIHVVFRDSKDLGYGRDMYARENPGGKLAFIVDNYVIRLQQGSSSNYGPVNVEAAVRQDRDHYRGTNAIEFSPIDPLDSTSEKITRFFTYNTSGQRITSADLDGRGVKHMPGMCLACHGGRLLPLNTDGSFPLLALRSAKLNQLEPDSFEYSTLAGYARADLEPGFKTFNRMVRDSYTTMAARDAGNLAKWSADFSILVAEGRYGGAGMPSPVYREDYVPPGWQQTGSRPEGVEELYKRVVEPHCVACHALQGHQAGEDLANSGEQPFANAINFSSWERFYSYREIIIDYVFHRGAMPLSLRNFEKFWQDPQDKPALLAAFLGDPSLFDSNGKVITPGHPVARPGPGRRAVSPVELDGSASSFATRYAWTIVSGPAGATLAASDTSTPLLTAATAGVYEVSLVVSNARGSSAPATQRITVDSAAVAAPNFVDDIMPILGSISGANCSSCHNAAKEASDYRGIPVFWSLADNPAHLYGDALARVNLADPEMSLLLRKPTGPRHGGGVQMDLSTPAGIDRYQTILNWVRAGAPCGPTGAVCP